MWCIAEITPEYRERTYRLLDLYQEEYDPDRPVVCMDEKSKQLIEDTRRPIAMKAGSMAKHDYEYRRTITVTRTRKKQDFATFVRDLAENRYGRAKEIRLVLDNLNTHFEKSFHETFPKEQAQRILDRISFFYTPKHGSWLNMAEIEINVMDRECLGVRIASEELMRQRLGPWTKERNLERKKIRWTFTKQDADKKLGKHYAP